MQLLTLADASAQTGRSVPRLRQLCAEGRIPGARKIGTVWVIELRNGAAIRVLPPERPVGRPRKRGRKKGAP